MLPGEAIGSSWSKILPSGCILDNVEQLTQFAWAVRSALRAGQHSRRKREQRSTTLSFHAARSRRAWTAGILSCARARPMIARHAEQGPVRRSPAWRLTPSSLQGRCGGRKAFLAQCLKGLFKCAMANSSPALPALHLSLPRAGLFWIPGPILGRHTGMRDSWDVVIVGGGIVGAACALECARIGMSTAVVEARGIGSGATAAGMGHIVVMDDSPRRWSLPIIRRRCGTIFFCASY